MHEKSSLSILLPFIKQMTLWRGKGDENLHFWLPPASSAASGKEHEKEDLPAEESAGRPEQTGYTDTAFTEPWENKQQKFVMSRS